MADVFILVISYKIYGLAFCIEAYLIFACSVTYKLFSFFVSELIIQWKEDTQTIIVTVTSQYVWKWSIHVQHVITSPTWTSWACVQRGHHVDSCDTRWTSCWTVQVCSPLSSPPSHLTFLFLKKNKRFIHKSILTVYKNSRVSERWWVTSQQ